jgi:F0F1-type ATP synthase membrane subunit b/b'
LAILFSLLYIFIKKRVLPDIETVLDNRVRKLNLLLLESENNNEKAKIIINKSLALEKDAKLKSLIIQKEIINKIKQENLQKLNQVSDSLLKHYEEIKRQYEKEILIISKDFPLISSDIENILVNKISNLYIKRA